MSNAERKYLKYFAPQVNNKPYYYSLSLLTIRSHA